jgi:hypothetical protein
LFTERQKYECLFPFPRFRGLKSLIKNNLSQKVIVMLLWWSVKFNASKRKLFLIYCVKARNISFNPFPTSCLVNCYVLLPHWATSTSTKILSWWMFWRFVNNKSCLFYIFWF